MNFGLNKVTGTGRQTVEQLKHKVIDGGGGGGGGAWQEVLVTDITLHTDEGGVIWYDIPADEEWLVETSDGVSISVFGITNENRPDISLPMYSVFGELDTRDLGIGALKHIPNALTHEIAGYFTGNDVDGGIALAGLNLVAPRTSHIWVCYYNYDEFAEPSPYENNTHIKFYKKV